MTEQTEYNDLPVEEIVEMMKNKIADGWTCYIKWSCEKCGERVFCDKPNAIFLGGLRHTEKLDGSICGHTSFPKKLGMLIGKNVDNLYVKTDKGD